MEAGNVVVIGSINMDLVAKTHRFPRPGETMAGESFYTSYGGKGANQAVTVARLGGAASFIGCVGADAFGKEMVDHLRQEGVDTGHVRTVENCSSGTALIIVDSAGRNQIIVIRGANEHLHPEDIDGALHLISAAKMVVIQLEIPLDTVRHAIARAHEHGAPVLLNPAPAPAGPLDSDILKKVSLLVPNEVEAEALTGLAAGSAGFPERCIRTLERDGAKRVIVTLGERGCAFSDGEAIRHLPAYPVRAEDTTGAGDAFVGALAASYSFFSRFSDAVKFASAVAALSVTKKGAQSSLPRREDVRRFLENYEPCLLEGFLAMK
jgi:ribokinase